MAAANRRNWYKQRKINRINSLARNWKERKKNEEEEYLKHEEEKCSYKKEVPKNR